jgi:hypothetical protein
MQLNQQYHEEVHMNSQKSRSRKPLVSQKAQKLEIQDLNEEQLETVTGGGCFSCFRSTPTRESASPLPPANQSPPKDTHGETSYDPVHIKNVYDNLDAIKQGVRNQAGGTSTRFPESTTLNTIIRRP